MKRVSLVVCAMLVARIAPAQQPQQPPSVRKPGRPGGTPGLTPGAAHSAGTPSLNPGGRTAATPGINAYAKSPGRSYSPLAFSAGPDAYGNRIDHLMYVLIPAGSFQMGCVPNDTQCQPE